MSAQYSLILEFQCLRTSAEILLVRKHQQQRILHFSVLDNPCEFLLGLVDTGAVVGVDDEDETLGACDCD